MRAELVELSAGELAAAMRRRDASPVEVVDAHLARIETCNPDLNALVALRQVGARQEAKAAEAALLRGDQLGPLHGIPFTVKDIIATAELPTTCGSGALAGYRPRADATAVARMRAAGGILLGKSNCPEFALGIFSSSPLFGRTQSPLGEITPGGSSAGESAAIAAGLSPLGLGTDFGGSLRWPAHCTGIASIRPTVGRVPGTGQVPGPAGHDSGPPNAVSLQGRLQVIGPLARTAADLDLALSVLVGPDGIDPAAVPVPLPRAADTDALALAYAWCDGDGSTPLRPDVVALVEQAATCLERLGATVVRHRPDGLDRAAAVYSRLREVDGLHDLRRQVQGQEHLLSEELSAMLASTREAGMAELAALWSERDMLRARFLSALPPQRILLLPVAAVSAFDERRGLPVVGGAELSQWDVVACCRAISLFGVPSAVVACGRSAEGLPIGVQVVGRPFHEHEVLAAAWLLEEELGQASTLGRAA